MVLNCSGPHARTRKCPLGARGGSQPTVNKEVGPQSYNCIELGMANNLMSFEVDDSSELPGKSSPDLDLQNYKINKCVLFQTTTFVVICCDTNKNSSIGDKVQVVEKICKRVVLSNGL